MAYASDPAELDFSPREGPVPFDPVHDLSGHTKAHGRIPFDSLDWGRRSPIRRDGIPCPRPNPAVFASLPAIDRAGSRGELPGGKASVVGRNPAWQSNRSAHGVETPREQLHQNPILEDAASEDNRVWREDADQFGHGIRRRAVESHRDGPGRGARESISQHGSDDGAPIELEAVRSRVSLDRHRVRSQRVPITDRFEPHGGLTFEIAPDCPERDRGDRVKEPPRARGDGAQAGVLKEREEPIAVRVARRGPNIAQSRRRLVGNRIANERDGDAPWLAHGPFAARQRERSQMAEPFVSGNGREKDFTAPDRAVRSIPGAVERDTQYLAIQPPGFEHGGDDMGVVVLDAYRFTAVLGKSACMVVGMKIADRLALFESVEFCELSALLIESVARRALVKIADMGSEDRLFAVAERDRRFLMSPQRLARLEGRDREGKRREAAREPDSDGAARNDSNDAVIERSADDSVVFKPCVRESFKTRHGVNRLEDKRLSLTVAARADQRCSRGIAQQGVKRSRREHEADGRELPGNGWSDRRFGTSPNDDDRPRRRGKACGLDVVQNGQFARMRK